jgi:osmotically-inducible protein OsmY
MADFERDPRGLFGYEGEGYVRGGYDRLAPEPRPSFRGRGPKNYQRTDERIREDVCERLTYDERVDATDIDVDVREGVVRLSGTVDDRYAKRLAEDVAESVRGIRDVENQIRVRRESR